MTFIYLKKHIRFFLMVSLLSTSSHLRAQNCPCTNTGMTAADFATYTNNYEITFRRAEPAKHTKWIFMPRNYFIFLAKFLDSASFNGITIFFVAHKNIIDNAQQTRSDQLLITLAAAHTPQDVDFDALHQFYQTNDILWDPKGNKVILSSWNGSKPSVIGPEFILPSDQESIDNYKAKNPRTRYSRAVYICKEQITKIKAFLDARPDFQGVKLNFASYKKIIDCVHNTDPLQLTLILVPAPNASAAPAVNEFLKFTHDKFLDDYFNHGELCPNSCPPNTSK